MEIAEEYVRARSVLLDALEALEDHLDNLVLIGAQAVYHHTGDSELSVPLMTTDGDLAINTSDLSDDPEIGRTMNDAGFEPGANPGHWKGAGEVVIDLMVAPHQSGTSKRTARAARLSPHSKQTARIAKGLEPALVDNSTSSIEALDADDTRAFDLRIAGPAALLTAKAIKIGERLGQAGRQPNRLKQKDSLDVFRILQAVDTEDLVKGFETHREDDQALQVSKEALEIYREHASSEDGPIVQLALAAAEGDPWVAPSFVALMSDLLNALQDANW